MNSKASKILGLFVLFFLGFLIFLARIFDITTSDRFLTTAIKKEIDSPLRGEIVSSDGFKAARSQKTYSVAVNPDNIKPEHYELFVKLFCTYSGMNEKDLKAMLKGDKRVILVDNIDARTAKNFRQLSSSLDKMKVFEPKKIGTKYFRYGLEVFENEFLRNYAYDDLFQPMLG
ncbi:MAG: penicillin-binding protein 2, partial [Campylobacterales bacterium]|nr:penicillin-binding protein 2 [Campylobacterales bacterium]